MFGKELGSVSEDRDPLKKKHVKHPSKDLLDVAHECSDVFVHWNYHTLCQVSRYIPWMSLLRTQMCDICMLRKRSLNL